MNSKECEEKKVTNISECATITNLVGNLNIKSDDISIYEMMYYNSMENYVN